MAPLIFIAAVIGIAIAAAAAWIVGLILLEKLFGRERVERYIKWRMQGAFVPGNEEK